MRKLVVLAIKEVLVTYRDVGALITMLVTPLVLTLAIAAAFGVDGDTTIREIPVQIINYDDGPFSQMIIDVFEEQADADLFILEMNLGEAEARERVDANEMAAVVIIPADYSQRILPLSTLVEDRLGLDLFALTPEAFEELSDESLQAIGELYFEAQEIDLEPAVVEIYASPARTISTAVIRGITTQVIERTNMTVAGTNAIFTRLFEAQIRQQVLEPPDDDVLPGFVDMTELDEVDATQLPIGLIIISPTGRPFNWLDYQATSMAILFLMFALTTGGRTLLGERQGGTLPRLMVAPMPAISVLLGKMAGVVMTGLLQVLVLWGATSLIGAYWGDPIGVIITIFMLVLSASGVGAMISAWAKTTGQVTAIGTSFTLIAAAVSGSFFPRMNLPEIVRQISLVTPNAWGIEIFSELQSGRSLVDILPMLGGLLAVTVFYYVIAAWGFRRQLN